MKTYKYDIAVSLCKEDVAFARQLCKALNPTLNIFFYEDKQEELVGKMGPEIFARIFKEEARVVVIIHRKTWGTSFYTEIENAAIVSRLKDEGYGFTFLIPLEKGKTPSWYPPISIYANPFDFSVEKLAKFIEFKINERGGDVKQLSLEEKIELLQNRMEEKRKFIEKLSMTRELVKAGENEMNRIVEIFNNKLKLVYDAMPNFSKSYNPLHPVFRYTKEPTVAEMLIEDIHLQIQLGTEAQFHYNFQSPQCFKVSFFLFTPQNKPGNTQPHIIKQSLYRFSSINDLDFGWAEQIVRTNVDDTSALYLFKAPMDNYYYDLGEALTAERLIEYWFTELINLVEEKMKPVLM